MKLVFINPNVKSKTRQLKSDPHCQLLTALNTMVQKLVLTGNVSLVDLGSFSLLNSAESHGMQFKTFNRNQIVTMW